MREELGSEIENLTASCFEEANNKIRNAEKQAKEAMMKLRMIQKEMQELKIIVQSTRLVRSERTLVNNDIKPTARRIIIGGELKNDKDDHEVNPIFHAEFVAWRQNPTLDKDVPFMKRIYEEDIKSCLDFTNTEFAALVLLAIENNFLSIEKIEDSKMTTQTCELLLVPRLCTHQLCMYKHKFNVCSFSCNRVAAAAELVGYIRFLHQGYLNFRLHRSYLEILKRRRQVNAATLGFTYYLD